MVLVDLGGVWWLEQVIGVLIDLVDRVIDLVLCVYVVYEIVCRKLFDIDVDVGGIIVLVMGKMGVGELNYFLDIDLIVFYDDSVYVFDDQYEVWVVLIWVMCKVVVMLLDNIDQGYVFCIDLWLWFDVVVMLVCILILVVFGYYEFEGWIWECGVYVKVCVCVGNIVVGQWFLWDLMFFVWCRYLDFVMIQDIDDMCCCICDYKGLYGWIEVLGYNMKLGQGGICEIEFFIQICQLIVGGCDFDLCVCGMVEGLVWLVEKGWVFFEVVEELIWYYCEYCDIEYCIQMVNDVQIYQVLILFEGVVIIVYLMGQVDIVEWLVCLVDCLVWVEVLIVDFFLLIDQGLCLQLFLMVKMLVDGWCVYFVLCLDWVWQVFVWIEMLLLVWLIGGVYVDDVLVSFDVFLVGLFVGVQFFLLFEVNL